MMKKLILFLLSTLLTIVGIGFCFSDFDRRYYFAAAFCVVGVSCYLALILENRLVYIGACLLNLLAFALFWTLCLAAPSWILPYLYEYRAHLIFTAVFSSAFLITLIFFWILK